MERSLDSVRLILLLDNTVTCIGFYLFILDFYGET